MSGNQAMRTAIQSAKKEAYKLYTKVKQDYTFDDRVDVFSIIMDERIWLRFENLSSLYGIILRSGGDTGIVLNSKHPEHVQRYTAAHELGHYFLRHRGTILDGVEQIERGMARRNIVGQPFQELQAQVFAASLLMPISTVNRLVKELGIGQVSAEPDVVYEFALRFGVSYRAAVQELTNLRFITSKQSDLLLDVKPAAVKSGRSHTSNPINPWASVWRVDDSFNREQVSVRVQDQLVIDLPEIPTSGYRWQIDARSNPAVTVQSDGYVDNHQESLIEQSSRVLGGTRTRHFVLQFSEPGRQLVTLQKKRPWEQASIKEVIIAASVEPLPADAAKGGVYVQQSERNYNSV